MATIGTFKKSGNEFTGSITTLSVQAKGVRIVPEETRTNDNAPSRTASSPARSRSAPPGASARTRAATISASSSTTQASPRRSSPTCSTTRATDSLQPDLVAQSRSGTATDRPHAPPGNGRGVHFPA